MDIFFGVLTLAALLVCFWSLFRFVFFKARGRSAKWLGLSFAVFVVAIIGLTTTLDKMAVETGFLGSSDRLLAKSHGYEDDAQGWAQVRDEFALRDAQAKEQAEADALIAAENTAENSDELSDAETSKIQSDDVCRADIRCWAESKPVSVRVACAPMVERLAKFDFEWTDGLLDSKFTHYRWQDKEAGVVAFIGDKIKLQNGFGAFSIHTYECDYDVENELVLDVRIQQGRL